jgi:hypothetical protein
MRRKRAQSPQAGSSAKVAIALVKKGHDLRDDIVNRAMHCGEAFEKTAGEEYFHQLRKPAVDSELLGEKFCKFAGATGIDPWELALQVADNFPAYAVLSKTASDPKAREVAQFYMDWAEEMEKSAFLGRLGFGAAGRMARASKEVAKATSAPKPGMMSRVKGMFGGQKAKMDQVIKAEKQQANQAARQQAMRKTEQKAQQQAQQKAQQQAAQPQPVGESRWVRTGPQRPATTPSQQPPPLPNKQPAAGTEATKQPGWWDRLGWKGKALAGTGVLGTGTAVGAHELQQQQPMGGGYA